MAEDTVTLTLAGELEIVRSRFARQVAERQRRKDGLTQQRREERKHILLTENWIPSCQCDRCISAILSLSDDRCSNWVGEPGNSGKLPIQD